MLTGRYPVRTLITSPLLSTYDAMNLVMEVFGRYSYNVRGIPQDEVLLPEALSRRGYRTGLMGKWHLGGEPGYLPNDRGFDSFYGALWSNDDQPYAIYHEREVAQPAPADQDYLTRDFTNAALDFIRSNREQPFFLYLAHVMPHVPTHASPAFRGAPKGGLYGDAVEELAGDFDGSRTLICAPVQAIACHLGEACETGRPDEVGAPSFLRIDFAKKAIVGPKRLTPIRNMEQDEKQILLQGTELGVGWNLALDVAEGKMVGTMSDRAAPSCCLARAPRCDWLNSRNASILRPRWQDRVEEG